MTPKKSTTNIEKNGWYRDVFKPEGIIADSVVNIHYLFCDLFQ
jgi:hypothetical protein